MSTRCQWLGCRAKPANWLNRLFVFVLLLNSQFVVLSQSDNFNDGDDLGWTRVDYSSQGGPVGTFTVTNGAYRLHYLISSNEMVSFGFPRIASYPADNNVFADFYLQVDLLDWERQLVGYALQGFGLMARAQPDIQTNGFSGYFFLFEPDMFIDFLRFEPDGTWCQCSQDSSILPQDPKTQYRLVFTGTGPALYGQLYDLKDLTTPIQEISTVDSFYAEGICGLWGMDFIGYQNFHGIPTPFTPNSTGPIDATFDNYVATNNPPPITIIHHPSSQTVVEAAPVTFSVQAEGAPPHTYQWMKNGLDIAGAEKARYSLRAELADQGATFSVRVSNSFSTQMSSNAVLTVLSNVTPPRVVNAIGMLDPTKVVITFSKPMSRLAATDPFNYGLEAVGGASPGILDAELTNGTTVVLTTEARIPDVNYVLTVRYLRDATSLQLEISPNPTLRDLAREVQLVAGDMQPWAYFQSDRDPGSGWQRPGFDDAASGWAIGPALFDGKRPPGRTEVGTQPVRTMLNLTNPPTATQITLTYYFRTRFNVPERIEGEKLNLRCFVDDGAVFYINGAEVFRFNMPPPPTVITYYTFSSTFRDAEVYDGPYEVPATNLVAGENLLAAEVHQTNLGSSDIDFAAQLTAILPPPPARLRVTPLGVRTTISWSGAGYLLEEAHALRGPWSLSPLQDNPQTIASDENTRFYRLRQ
ncbi:MAG: hypothetical protein L0Y58_07120 [Verrucomicrobia subdivision 3 bacterium]|nr:hypothetical protein [Limisphaerales bacterium]